MTNLEALKSEVIGYPVQDATLQVILVDRSLIATDEYVGKSKAFNLCIADLYTKMLSAANIDEGNYSVSMTDKSNMMTVASGIYDRYGEYNPHKKRPSVKAIRRW